ncbi:MAG: metallophosphoesterase, partial [Candidatus Gracilibacteria bacterium]
FDKEKVLKDLEKQEAAIQKKNDDLYAQIKTNAKNQDGLDESEKLKAYSLTGENLELATYRTKLTNETQRIWRIRKFIENDGKDPLAGKGSGTLVEKNGVWSVEMEESAKIATGTETAATINAGVTITSSADKEGEAMDNKKAQEEKSKPTPDPLVANSSAQKPESAKTNKPAPKPAVAPLAAGVGTIQAHGYEHLATLAAADQKKTGSLWQQQKALNLFSRMAGTEGYDDTKAKLSREALGQMKTEEAGRKIFDSYLKANGREKTLAMLAAMNSKDLAKLKASGISDKGLALMKGYLSSSEGKLTATLINENRVAKKDEEAYLLFQRAKWLETNVDFAAAKPLYDQIKTDYGDTGIGKNIGDIGPGAWEKVGNIAHEWNDVSLAVMPGVGGAVGKVAGKVGSRVAARVTAEAAAKTVVKVAAETAAKEAAQKAAAEIVAQASGKLTTKAVAKGAEVAATEAAQKAVAKAASEAGGKVSAWTIRRSSQIAAKEAAKAAAEEVVQKGAGEVLAGAAKTGIKVPLHLAKEGVKFATVKPTVFISKKMAQAAFKGMKLGGKALFESPEFAKIESVWGRRLLAGGTTITLDMARSMAAATVAEQIHPGAGEWTMMAFVGGQGFRRGITQELMPFTSRLTGELKSHGVPQDKIDKIVQSANIKQFEKGGAAFKPFNAGNEIKLTNEIRVTPHAKMDYISPSGKSVKIDIVGKNPKTGEIIYSYQKDGKTLLQSTKPETLIQGLRKSHDAMMQEMRNNPFFKENKFNPLDSLERIDVGAGRDFSPIDTIKFKPRSGKAIDIRIVGSNKNGEFAYVTLKNGKWVPGKMSTEELVGAIDGVRVKPAPKLKAKPKEAVNAPKKTELNERQAAIAKSAKIKGPRRNPERLPYEQVKRPTGVVTIGDLHGDLTAFNESLLKKGLTDKSGKWIGGNKKLVQTGDIFDRGEESVQIVKRIQELRKQGADIEVLIGNHEDMLLRGIMGNKEMMNIWLANNPGTELMDIFQKSGSKGILEHLKKNGALDLIKEMKLVQQVDDVLYVHAEISRDLTGFIRKNGGIDNVNAKFKTGLDKAIKGDVTELENFSKEYENLLWSREHSKGKLSRGDLDAITSDLKDMGVNVVVHGHTPQRGGMQAVQEINGVRIINNDIAMSKGMNKTGSRAGGVMIDSSGRQTLTSGNEQIDIPNVSGQTTYSPTA